MTLKELKKAMGLFVPFEVQSAYDGKVLFRSWRNKKELLTQFEELNVVSIAPKLRLIGDAAYPYIEIVVSDYCLR